MGDHHSFLDENTNTGPFQPHRPCSTNDTPCQECINLLELEWQLEVARKVYTDLLARHRPMKRKVNQAHDPICRRLPTEIVARIFDFSVPRLTTVGTATQDAPEDFDYSAPLKLGAVCTTWREIAWSTPSLWTFISIRFNPSKFPARGVLAQQWLQRSGCLPLYLFLHVTSADKVVQTVSFYPLIKTINTCSDRWRVLDVDLPSSLSTLLRPQSATNICTSIHTLRLSYKPSPQETRFNEGFNAPSLAPIAISISRLLTRSVKIKWDRLTIACLSNFRLKDAIQFCTRVPQLESYTLQTQISNSTEGIPLAYTHTKLTRLHVKDAYNTFGAFFEVITLPSLQHLTLSCSEGHITSPPILPILTAFFERSQCLLTCLSFTIRPESQRWSDILPLLHAAPSIEQLTLEVAHPASYGMMFRQFAEAFSKSRSTSRTTEVLLPNLLDYKHREVGSYYNSGWRPLVESLTASAAHFEIVRDPRVTKMTPSFLLVIHERAASADWSTLYDEDLIDRDLIPDVIKIMDNGVSLAIHAITEVHEYDGTITTIRGAYYDVIKASMDLHQFSQQEIDEYAKLAVPVPPFC